MKGVVFLLVLLFCFLAYMRAQQPAIWNSWLAQLRVVDSSVSENTADSENTNDATAPVAPLAPAAQPAPTPSTATVAVSTPAAPAAPAPAPPPPSPRPQPRMQLPVGGLLQNGNFLADGGGWQGDGIADPSGKGLTVNLSPTSWTRVYQVFAATQGTQLSIVISYKLSPGLTLSSDPADYTDINKRLQISGFEDFKSEQIPPGNFFGIVGDPNTPTVCCEFFPPKLGFSDVQAYQHTYPPNPPSAKTIFAVAFPPGSGTVTLETAYVTRN